MVITLSVIIWWILIGLVVGAVARLVIPGRQHIGIILTGPPGRFPPRRIFARDATSPPGATYSP